MRTEIEEKSNADIFWGKIRMRTEIVKKSNADINWRKIECGHFLWKKDSCPHSDPSPSISKLLKFWLNSRNKGIQETQGSKEFKEFYEPRNSRNQGIPGKVQFASLPLLTGYPRQNIAWYNFFCDQKIWKFKKKIKSFFCSF